MGNRPLSSYIRRGFAGFSLLAGLAFVAVAPSDSRDLETYIKADVDKYDRMLGDVPKLFFAEHGDTLFDASARYDVPAEFVAALIINEHESKPRWRDWADTFLQKYNNAAGDTLGMVDVSLGPGQVNVETAQSLDAYFHGTAKSYEETMDALRSAEGGIEYVAMCASYLLHRPHRLGDRESATLLDDPQLMGIVATEYNIGGRLSATEDALVNTVGAQTLLIIAQTDWYDVLGSRSTMRSPQQEEIVSLLQNSVRTMASLDNGISLQQNGQAYAVE